MSDAQYDSEYGAQVLAWAQRLMITKGYGWSKAVDKARDLASAPRKPPKAKRQS